MPSRANTRILLLDATFTALSLGALGYYSWLGDFYSASLCLILLTIAGRHLLNDWQSLQITPIKLSLRTTRRSWRIDTITLCLEQFVARRSSNAASVDYRWSNPHRTSLA